MKKTQFFSTEVIITFLLFIFLFGVCMIVWWNKTQELNSNLLNYDLQIGASNAMEMIIYSSGNPHNWTTSSFNQLGISDNYHRINYEKLNKLISLCENNYTYTAELLGFAEYNYFIILEDFNQNEILTCNNNSAYEVGVLWRENVIMNNTNYVLKIGVLS